MQRWRENHSIDFHKFSTNILTGPENMPGLLKFISFLVKNKSQKYVVFFIKTAQTVLIKFGSETALTGLATTWFKLHLSKNKIVRVFYVLTCLNCCFTFLLSIGLL